MGVLRRDALKRAVAALPLAGQEARAQVSRALLEKEEDGRAGRRRHANLIAIESNQSVTLKAPRGTTVGRTDDHRKKRRTRLRAQPRLSMLVIDRLNRHSSVTALTTYLVLQTRSKLEALYSLQSMLECEYIFSHLK